MTGDDLRTGKVILSSSFTELDELRRDDETEADEFSVTPRTLDGPESIAATVGPATDGRTGIVAAEIVPNVNPELIPGGAADAKEPIAPLFDGGVFGATSELLS